MKYFSLLLTVPALLALSLVFRPNPRGPEAAGPVALPKAVATEPGFREAAHETPAATPSGTPVPARAQAAGEDLLSARIALGCGTCLLGKARQADTPLAVALLELAAEQFRTCLRYEPEARATPEVFADARRQLEQARELLARAGHPDQPAAKAPESPEVLPPAREAGETPRDSELLPVPEKTPPVVEKPAPPGRVPAETKVTGPVMVGPDGVIYRRAGTGGR